MEKYHSKESTKCFHLVHTTIKQLYISVPICTYLYLAWASLDFSLCGEDLRGWVDKEEKK